LACELFACWRASRLFAAELLIRKFWAREFDSFDIRCRSSTKTEALMTNNDPAPPLPRPAARTTTVGGADGSRLGAMRLARAARVLAWICVAAITVLSLVPGAFRPHTFLPGRIEHFVAYAGTGFFFALGYLDARLRLFAWLGLAIASGVFEILQDFVPGRSPSPLDALASTGGLTFGLAIGLVAEAALTRIRR
jgi:VanZ family protein